MFRRAFILLDLTECTTEREINCKGGEEYVTKISKSCNTIVTKRGYLRKIKRRIEK
jgi:hypothetical protein